jgi:hypothetical protein
MAARPDLRAMCICLQHACWLNQWSTKGGFLVAWQQVHECAPVARKGSTVMLRARPEVQCRRPHSACRNLRTLQVVGTFSYAVEYEERPAHLARPGPPACSSTPGTSEGSGCAAPASSTPPGPSCRWPPPPSPLAAARREKPWQGLAWFTSRSSPVCPWERWWEASQCRDKASPGATSL